MEFNFSSGEYKFVHNSFHLSFTKFYSLQMKGVLECAHILPLFPDENLCNLLLRKCSIIKELVDSLEILYNATMTCQKADLNLTEFYKCWIITKVKIQSRINQPSVTKLDSHLLKAMAKRESKLIGNQLITVQ